MKHRPWSIVILALCHFLAPIGNLFLNSIWANRGFFEYIQLYFQPHNISRNYPNLLLPILGGFAIYACKKWSFWIYLLAMAGLFIKSAFAYAERSATLSPWVLLFIFSCNAIIVGYILLPVVRELYFDPRLRWWETSPRYYFETPGEIRCAQGQFPGTVKNISRTGAYFQSTTEIAERTDYWISFTVDQVKLEIHGELIKHLGARIPSYGFKFDEKHQYQKQILASIERLDREGKIVASRQKSQEDTLVFWLKNLFKTGKGILPEIQRSKKDPK